MSEGLLYVMSELKHYFLNIMLTQALVNVSSAVVLDHSSVIVLGYVLCL